MQRADIEFFDGSMAIGHAAQLAVRDNRLIVQADGREWVFAASELNPALPTPHGRRLVYLPAEQLLDFAHSSEADAWLAQLSAPELRRSGWFARHYQSASFLAGSLAVFVALISALYVWVLPQVADGIAAKLPDDLLNTPSKEILAQLTQDGTLQTSHLSAERQLQIAQRFNQLVKPDTDVPFNLHFYRAPEIGPNAFALPSGDVVLLDELSNIATEEQIMGVLSHELGHVAHRHALRGMVQNSIVSYAVAAWMGDYGSMVINFGASTVLTQKYSRDFERESDAYAIKMLQMNQIRPAVLAEFFGVMEQAVAKENNKKADKKDTDKNKGSSWLDFMRSHPPTQERIDTLRRSSAP